MIESFITAFIIYFVVIDPVGNAPVFLAVTTAQTRRQKFRTAIEATMFASFIMLFFALCGAWVLAYLKITQPAFSPAFFSGVSAGGASLPLAKQKFSGGNGALGKIRTPDP